MHPGFIVRFRPAGPWRFGPDSGARDHVDRICHSDTLYSAVSSAFAQLGMAEEWFEATARSPVESAVRFSSCFPFVGDQLLAPPPRNLWPPPPSAKIRWKGARFVPLSVTEGLLSDRQPDEEAWAIDGVSECLVPVARASGTKGPFRVAVRSAAGVDRLLGGIVPHSTACLEFTPDAGMWAVAGFADEAARDRWSVPLKGALQLLADSGIGGERSRGWGRSETPEFTDGTLPDLLLAPRPAPPPPAEGEEAPAPVETAWWLLSLFSPSGEDVIDWERGSYGLVTRGGRVESPVKWGDVKKPIRMVEEGSVLFSGAAPRGGAPDVAPDGFPHPVFRAGFALSISIPWRVAS